MTQTDNPELDDLFERYKAAPKSQLFAPLADACRKAGMLEEALEICARGVGEHPRYASGYVVQGKCLYDARRTADAQAAFDRVLALDPKNLVALKYLGILHAERGDNARAREYFEHILALDPDNRDIRSRIEDVVIENIRTPQASVRADDTMKIDVAAVHEMLAQENVEDDVVADRVGASADGSGRLRRLGTGVHAHLAEIVPKPVLHESLCIPLERLRRRMQTAMNTLGSGDGFFRFDASTALHNRRRIPR